MNDQVIINDISHLRISDLAKDDFLYVLFAYCWGVEEPDAPPFRLVFAVLDNRKVNDFMSSWIELPREEAFTKLIVALVHQTADSLQHVDGKDREYAILLAMVQNGEFANSVFKPAGYSLTAEMVGQYVAKEDPGIPVLAFVDDLPSTNVKH